MEPIQNGPYYHNNFNLYLPDSYLVLQTNDYLFLSHTAIPSPDSHKTNYPLLQ